MDTGKGQKAPRRKRRVAIPNKKNSSVVSDRWERFVEEYLVDLNPSKAYTRVYGATGKSATMSAWKLMQKQEIQDAIDKAIEARARRTHVSQDRVVKELAKVGFSNMGEFARWSPYDVQLVDSDKLTDEQKAAVADISTSINEYGTTVKIRLHPKIESLALLGKHLGMFREKDPNEDRDPIEEARRICQLVKEMDGTIGGATTATASSGGPS